MLIEDINVSVSFLNDSKTFVGVLSTIVLMCVLIGDNNFIYKILKTTVNQIQNKYKDKTTKINKAIKDILDFGELTGNAQYKVVILWADENNARSSDDALKIETLNLIRDVQNKCQQFRFKYIKPVPRALNINNKPKDQEHFLAPLYCFFFTIIIFVFDEVLRTKQFPYNDFFISVLSVFTFISYLYWGRLWCSYSVHLFNGRNKKNVMGKKGNSLLRKILLMFLLMVVSIIVIHCNPTQIVLNRIIYFLFVIIIPSIIVCNILGMDYESDKNEPQYSQLLFHLAILFIVSIIFAGFSFFCFNYFDSMKSMWLSYSNCVYLKMACILFILINGLLCPLVLPFLCYWCLYKIVSNTNLQIKKVKKEQHKLVTKLLKQVQNTSEKIKVESPLP